MTRTLPKLALAAGALFLSFALPARAAFVALNDPAFGPGSITQDTATGLEWLDIDLTAGLSYNDVAAGFGPGGAFEGFAHASLEQVDTLFLNAGFSATDNVLRNEDIPAANHFFAFLGISASAQGVGSSSFGVTSTTAFTGNPRVAYVSLSIPDDGASAYALGAPPSTFNFDQTSPGTGQWLVRPAATLVPLPAPFMLLGGALGLLSLTATRRKAA